MAFDGISRIPFPLKRSSEFKATKHAIQFSGGRPLDSVSLGFLEVRGSFLDEIGRNLLERNLHI